MISLLDANAFLRKVEGDVKLATLAKSRIANPNNEIPRLNHRALVARARDRKLPVVSSDRAFPD